MSEKMTLQEKIDETFDEMAEEEYSTKSDFKRRTYDAAKRRIDRDSVAKVAVLVSFIGTIFAGMAVSYLNEQKILTAEGAILIIGGGLIYVGFRLFVLVYNYLSLRLQKTAIELDIKEAKVRRSEAETDAYEAREKAKIESDKLRFMKEQNRLDMKLRQDLQLRGPFFQDAQKHMMNLFARDDITAALKGASSFTEAVERMDDTLLKRTSFDLTIDKMNARITDIMVQYDDMCRQTKENNQLLNQLIQRDAELTVKWKETDVALKRCEKQMESIHTSMNTLMEVFYDSVKTLNGQKDSEETEETEEVTEPGPVEKPSITMEVEELLEKSTKVATDTNLVTDKMEIHTDTTTLTMGTPADEEIKEEEEDEESDLSPPPAD